MVGLGNIGTEIGRILFDLIKDETFTVKLYRYKDHAEKFIEKFSHYSNITFEICGTYEDLMRGSDVIVSSVTYIENDFCDPSVYKEGCTIIPVHLRGFKECDKVFGRIITSDLESIKKFEYYGAMKNIQYMDEVFNNLTINKIGGNSSKNDYI